MFMRLLYIPVQRLQVNFEFTEVFGLQLSYLQLNGYEAVEPTVKKQQIEREVLAANLQWVFGADIAEITPQFGEEPAEILY